MTITPSAPAHFVGCDVGKTALVVFDSRDQSTKTVPNQPEPLAAFAATIDDSCLVVCEATGRYEAALLHAMVQAGHAAHRADARKVKAFIRSFGTLGKTDAIDARALARYGQERHAELSRWQALDPKREQLQALVLTRRDLVNDRTAYKNRLDAPGPQGLRDCLERVVRCFDDEIEALEADIKALIEGHEELSRGARILCSFRGVGLVTAAAIMGLMPELGTLNRRKAAALAGLAPHPRQSGAADAYRRTKGGRPEVRKVLFMAALTAARRDPKMKAFYERLLANGKKKMVALVAVMRKMIVVCNAMLRPIVEA